MESRAITHTLGEDAAFMVIIIIFFWLSPFGSTNPNLFSLYNPVCFKWNFKSRNSLFLKLQMKSSMGVTHKMPFVLLFIIHMLSVYLQFSQVYFPQIVHF